MQYCKFEMKHQSLFGQHIRKNQMIWYYLKKKRICGKQTFCRRVSNLLTPLGEVSRATSFF